MQLERRGQIMNFGKKLKDLRSSKKINQQDLAKLMNVSRSTVANWETQGKMPDVEKQKWLSEYFGISIDELLGNKVPDANINLPNRENETISIPVLGSVPAGIPVEAIEDIVETTFIPKSWANSGNEFVGLLVTGDSMEPKYQVGDILILEVQQDCESGEDAVVFVNGYDATLKKVKKVGNRIILQPLNPKYSPMDYGPGDDEVIVFGVVRRFIRNV